MKFRWICLLAAAAVVLPAQDTSLAKAWKVIEDTNAQGNSIQRAQLMNSLAAAGTTPRSIAILEAALSDKATEVRQAAAAVLGDVKSLSSIPKLVTALDDDAPEVSFTAARSLWNMGDQSGRDIFLEVIAGERGNSPGLIKGGMRQAKHKLHNPAALAMMGVKESAGMFLGPVSMGITVFEELRKDGSASARTLAAALLATDPDPLLSDDHHRVRYVAAAAIVALAQPAS